MEVLTDRRSDDAEQVADMILDTLKRKGPSHADAVRVGKSVRNRKEKASLKRADTIKAWKDKSIATNQGAADRIGLSIPTCIRRYGNSGRQIGRRKQE